MGVSGVLKKKFELKAAERVTYGVAISIIFVNLAMISFKGAQIDWQGLCGHACNNIFAVYWRCFL